MADSPMNDKKPCHTSTLLPLLSTCRTKDAPAARCTRDRPSAAAATPPLTSCVSDDCEDRASTDRAADNSLKLLRAAETLISPALGMTATGVTLALDKSMRAEGDTSHTLCSWSQSAALCRPFGPSRTPTSISQLPLFKNTESADETKNEDHMYLTCTRQRRGRAHGE